ncbi:MAG: iron ABC transporter permease, partial [Acidobacteria bacterium]|nr:iron ABC transporter permease [Acidobacteriota bacterium]
MKADLIGKLLSRRTPFLPSLRSLTLGVAAAIFIGLCALPAIYMFGLSFTGADGHLSFENYRRLLVDVRQRDLLRSSVLLGAGASMLATLIGAPLGLLLARARVRGKAWWRLSLVIPLIVPPYVLALAWTWLAGSIEMLAERTYSLTGAIVVLGVSFYPLAMLATEASARRVDAGLEEAALLVAAPRRVFAMITLPLIAPAVAAAALIIFALAISEFGAPGLLRVNVFTTEVFTAFAAFYDFGAATALSAPLLMATFITALAARLIIGEQMLTTRRGSRIGLSLTLDQWQAPVMALLLAIIGLCVILPVGVIVREAGGLRLILSSLNDSRDAIINSFALAGVGATLVVALAALVGYGRARLRTRWSGFLDLAFITLFAVPGTVVGIGLIGLWNHADWRGEIYTSRLIIVIAYLARFAPVAALLLAASVRQIPVSFEEAARVAGASWPRTFCRIVLPQMFTGLSAAWVIAFIFAIGEIGAT